MKSSHTSISVDDRETLLIPEGVEIKTAEVEPSAKKNFKIRYLLSAAILAVFGVSASVTHRSGESVSGNCHGSAFVWNQRSSARYSTLSDRAGLAMPGSELVISPKDNFYTFLPDGKSKFNEVKEEALSGELDAQHVVGIIGREKLKIWAEKSLGHKVTHRAVMSKPSMELAGENLVVKSAKTGPLMGKLAIAHQVEEDKFLCHVPEEEVHIIEITVGVSKNDEKNPSEENDETLYVACHMGLACHIMNVGDEVYGF